MKICPDYTRIGRFYFNSFVSSFKLKLKLKKSDKRSVSYSCSWFARILILILNADLNSTQDLRPNIKFIELPISFFIIVTACEMFK